MSEAVTTADQPSLWAEVRGGLAGRSRDHTTGSLGRAVIVLSVPMMLEMVMQSVFGIVDVLFVGRLGAEAVAAVGLTDSLLTIVFAIGLGLAMATTAMVARRVGSGEPAEASRVAIQALALGVVIALPLGLTGALFGGRFLALMGAGPPTIAVGTTYARVVLGGASTVLFLFLINAVFRGSGDAGLAMRCLWLANLLNIVLDPLLIFGWGPIPALGVTGAGIATTLARGIGVAYQLSLLLRGSGILRLTREHLALDRVILERLGRIGSTGAVQYLVGTASWLVIMRLIAAFGSAALAGYTISVRILIFALLPAWGMANAAATLVGQNLGAAQPERAERAVHLSATWTAAFLSLIGGALVVLAEPLVRPFSSDPEVVTFGASCLRIVAISYPFFALGMVAVQSFNGAGDTRTPTWINFLCYWVLELPLAWLLSKPLGWGPRGIFAAIAVAQLAIAAVGQWAFRRGTWKSLRL